MGSTALSPSSAQRAFVLLLGLFFLPAVIGLGLVLILSSEYGLELSLLALLLLVIMGPVVARVINGTFDVFEPITVLVAVYTFYFVIGPAINLLTGQYLFVGRDFRPLYAEGLILLIFGVASLWVGYHLPIGHKLGAAIAGRIKSDVAELATLRRYAWALTLLAVTGFVMWSVISNHSILQYFLRPLASWSGQAETQTGGLEINYLFLCIEWLIPAFVILLASGGLRNRVVRYAYLTATVVLYASIGFRYRLVILVAAIVIAAYLRRKTRPRVVSLIAAMLVIFTLVGFVGGSRIATRLTGEATLGPSQEQFISGTTSDTRIFDAYLAVVDAVPERINYAYLEPIGYIFIIPIPRFIWPDKPFPDYLNDVHRAIGTSEALYSGAAIPHFGEYYLAFGIVGLILGMAAFGVGCRALWGFYKANPDNGWVRVIFAVSSGFLVQAIIRGYLSQIVSQWFFTIFPIFVGIYLARFARSIAAR